MSKLQADVLIQAGHEGRTSGVTGASGPIANEIEWTPIVADATTLALEAAGVDVLRVQADDIDDAQDAEVEIAVAIHFDGSGTPCASGASVGYPAGNPPGSNAPFAQRWKEVYGEYWPFKWMPDNFTRGLRGYGDYSDWFTGIAECVFELGEISCREQAEWLQPRLEWIGQLLAFTIGEAIGVDVPHPGDFEVAEPEPEPEPVPAPKEDDDVNFSDLPLVRLGDSGNKVRRVQALLLAAGVTITVDGRFGPITDRTVRGFQKSKGIGVDGIVGPVTWRTLWEASG